MVVAQKIHKTTCLKIQELGTEKQGFTQLKLYFFKYFEFGSFCEVSVDISSKYQCYTYGGFGRQFRG